MILETDRLCLREMNQDDYGALCKILQDEEVLEIGYLSCGSTGIKDMQQKPPKRVRNMPLKHWTGMRFVPLSGIRMPLPGMWPSGTE